MQNYFPSFPQNKNIKNINIKMFGLFWGKNLCAKKKGIRSSLGSEMQCTTSLKHIDLRFFMRKRGEVVRCVCWEKNKITKKKNKK